MNTPNAFAKLLWTMQRALALGRKMVAAGPEDAELRELLFQSRRLLAAMRQHADLAPDEERDSLIGLCESVDGNLRKLEHSAAQRVTIVH
ncbi:MAG TPA: hypothetical protein VLI21_13285 [Casimicrobiaceae bacterium]|nr:hypothetical protein [Casimicrobiaceae bacterium]